MTPLTKYPNLPRLPVDKCLLVFSKTGFTDSLIEHFSGVTRMQLRLWRIGSTKRPRKSSAERVSELAYKVLRAASAKSLPIAGRGKVGRELWAQALDDATHGASLSDADPKTLLPSTWLAELNPTPRHDDATEAVS